MKRRVGKLIATILVAISSMIGAATALHAGFDFYPAGWKIVKEGSQWRVRAYVCQAVQEGVAAMSPHMTLKKNGSLISEADLSFPAISGGWSACADSAPNCTALCDDICTGTSRHCGKFTEYPTNCYCHQCNSVTWCEDGAPTGGVLLTLAAGDKLEVVIDSEGEYTEDIETNNSASITW